VPELHGGFREEELLMRVGLLVAMMCTTITSTVIAQKTGDGAGSTETATATIRRIDRTTRFVVLRGDDGSETGVFAPPEFKRFNELRVGDVVTITYYESVVSQLRRPRARKPSVSEEISATESTSALPGLTLSHQQTERVTVKAVDRDASSITVTNRHGRTVSRHVERLSDLDGVKRGDHVDITYTEAVLATVARAK